MISGQRHYLVTGHDSYSAIVSSHRSPRLSLIDRLLRMRTKTLHGRTEIFGRVRVGLANPHPINTLNPLLRERQNTRHSQAKHLDLPKPHPINILR